MGVLDLFRPDPRKQLQQQLRSKMQQAVELQRNGKMLEFARMSAEVEELNRQLEALDAASVPSRLG